MQKVTLTKITDDGGGQWLYGYKLPEFICRYKDSKQKIHPIGISGLNMECLHHPVSNQLLNFTQLSKNDFECHSFVNEKLKDFSTIMERTQTDALGQIWHSTTWRSSFDIGFFQILAAAVLAIGEHFEVSSHEASRALVYLPKLIKNPFVFDEFLDIKNGNFRNWIEAYTLSGRDGGVEVDKKLHKKEYILLELLKLNSDKESAFNCLTMNNHNFKLILQRLYGKESIATNIMRRGKTNRIEISYWLLYNKMPHDINGQLRKLRSIVAESDGQKNEADLALNNLLLGYLFNNYTLSSPKGYFLSRNLAHLDGGQGDVKDDTLINTTHEELLSEMRNNFSHPHKMLTYLSTKSILNLNDKDVGQLKELIDNNDCNSQDILTAGLAALLCQINHLGEESLGGLMTNFLLDVDTFFNQYLGGHINIAEDNNLVEINSLDSTILDLAPLSYWYKDKNIKKYNGIKVSPLFFPKSTNTDLVLD